MIDLLSLSPDEAMALKARREANRAAGRPLDAPTPEEQAKTAADAERDARVLEKAEQTAITKMARAIGFIVRTTSEPRAKKSSPDFPDLWFSRKPTDPIRFVGWWETKKQIGGSRMSGQVDFGNECSGLIPYGYGDRFDFAQWLTEHGFTPPPFPQD